MDDVKDRLSKTILSEQPMKVIVEQIEALSRSGMDIKELKNTVSSAVDIASNKLSIERVDDMDDIIAALEGWCSSDCRLHPSQIQKIQGLDRTGYKLFLCDQSTGNEGVLNEGTFEKIMCQFQKEIDFGRDVWVIDPEGKKFTSPISYPLKNIEL